MADESPESLIPYDEIVQEALRDVVGRVLSSVEKGGSLPGGHHFYITFRTRMAGVEIPKHLAQRFPDEMTIVIQHRYWDLHVAPDFFTVGLSFGGLLPTNITGPLVLTISGTSAFNGSYAGTLNVSAVPEPETYAMMLGGLGLLGFMARRRKQQG